MATQFFFLVLQTMMLKVNGGELLLITLNNASLYDYQALKVRVLFHASVPLNMTLLLL